MKYTVYIKKPVGRASIWAGPGHQGGGVIPTPESSKDLTRRAHVENQLRTISEQEPVWHKGKYAYIVEIPEDKVEEVKKWAKVRNVVAE